MKRTIQKSSAILLALLLHACGGGGGGGGAGNPPPPPPGMVSLTQANAIAAGSLTFEASESGLRALRILSSAAFTLHQNSLATQNFQCTVFGTLQMFAQDNDRNNALSPGDRIIVTYIECNQITGTINLLISQIAFNSGFVSAVSGTFTIDLLFEGTVDTRNAGGGNLQHTLTANEINWLGTNLSILIGRGNQVEEFTNGRIDKSIFAPALNFEIAISGTIDSDSLGGRFTFASGPPYIGREDDWPTGGTATASGNAGSRVAYSPAAGAGMMSYQVDADGNGQFEFMSPPQPWTDIALGELFGLQNGVGNPPPGPDAFCRRVALGATAEDMQVDPARARIYVTLPDRNELVVLSTNTLEVVQRVLVGPRPRAMSLSLDGEELFIGLGAAGEIAIVDLDTFAVSRVFVAATLGTSLVHDVAEASPGAIFVTHRTSSAGALMRLDRASGDQVAVQGIGNPPAESELLPDPARDVFYLGTGDQISPQSLYKFDASDPQTPLLLEDTPGTIGGTERMSLSPDGTRLYLRTGQVIRTGDFVEIGRIAMGVPAAADNGADVMVAANPGTIHVNSAPDLSEVDVLTTDCAIGQVERFAASSVDGHWLMLGGSTLCAVDLNNPFQPPGSGQPGVPANPPPALNVSVADLALGAEAFDAEFDHGRNLIYVSLPSTGEIVTVDAATHLVTQRAALGNAPRGLDLSPDESVLAIIFNGNGNLGLKDLASGQTEFRDLTPQMVATEGHDVAYVSDDAIFASADRPSSVAFLVRTSRLDPSSTVQLGNGNVIRDQPELIVSPDNRFLIAAESGQILFKFDLTDPGTPLDSVHGLTGFLSADRMSVSPEGARIALRTGEVLRTDGFTQAGQLGLGVPLYSSNGAFVYSAGAPGRIDRYDTSSYVSTQTIQGNCSIGTPRRLLANTAQNVLVTVGQSRLCFWLLDQPAASSIRIGPRSSYVCGADCLLRRYTRRSGSRESESMAMQPRGYPDESGRGHAGRAEGW